MNTKQLRQKILDLAIRGKLVPQVPRWAFYFLDKMNLNQYATATAQASTALSVSVVFG